MYFAVLHNFMLQFHKSQRSHDVSRSKIPLVSAAAMTVARRLAAAARAAAAATVRRGAAHHRPNKLQKVCKTLHGIITIRLDDVGSGVRYQRPYRGHHFQFEACDVDQYVVSSRCYYRNTT